MPWRWIMTAERRYANLTDLQATGLACVKCRKNYLTAPAGTRSVAVGLSAVNGWQVFACATPCAELLQQGAAVTP